MIELVLVVLWEMKNGIDLCILEKKDAFFVPETIVFTLALPLSNLLLENQKIPWEKSFEIISILSFFSRFDASTNEGMKLYKERIMDIVESEDLTDFMI